MKRTKAHDFMIIFQPVVPPNRKKGDFSIKK